MGFLGGFGVTSGGQKVMINPLEQWHCGSSWVVGGQDPRLAKRCHLLVDLQCRPWHLYCVSIVRPLLHSPVFQRMEEKGGGGLVMFICIAIHQNHPPFFQHVDKLHERNGLWFTENLSRNIQTTKDSFQLSLWWLRSGEANPSQINKVVFSNEGIV